MCLPRASCTPAPASTRRLRGAVPLAWKGTKCKASAWPREMRFWAEANGGSQFPFSISRVIFIQLLLFLLFQTQPAEVFGVSQVLAVQSDSSWTNSLLEAAARKSLWR